MSETPNPCSEPSNDERFFTMVLELLVVGADLWSAGAEGHAERCVIAAWAMCDGLPVRDREAPLDRDDVDDIDLDAGGP